MLFIIIFILFGFILSFYIGNTPGDCSYCVNWKTCKNTKRKRSRVACKKATWRNIYGEILK